MTGWNNGPHMTQEIVSSTCTAVGEILRKVKVYVRVRAYVRLVYVQLRKRGACFLLQRAEVLDSPSACETELEVNLTAFDSSPACRSNPLTRAQIYISATTNPEKESNMCAKALRSIPWGPREAQTSRE